MLGWSLDDRVVCAALMAVGGALLGLRLRPKSARVAWSLVLIAGLSNALVVSLHPRNLVNINVVHHYLGAKYPIPYPRFYQALNAARTQPQVLMRDLEHPPAVFREDPREQRAYFIDLMREAQAEFDPLASLDVLRERAERTGVIEAEAEKILADALPAGRIDAFRADVGRALEQLQWERDITTDYGYNASPLYAALRHADPTLHREFSRYTAVLNLAWQVLAVFALAWLVGAALNLRFHERTAIAALIFAAWDFVGYALPGLVFASLWIPLAVALYAMSRRRFEISGAAMAWAGLMKLFPFVLALPAVVGAVRSLAARPRNLALLRASLYTLVGCVVGIAVLGWVATLSGRSWSEFVHKILAQFQSEAYLLNSVSLSQGLLALGIFNTVLVDVASVVALLLVAGIFARGDVGASVDSHVRQSLVLVGAVGWFVHTWFNYYSIAPLLLLPWLARQHRVIAAAAAASMALAYLLPEFDDPTLLSSRALHACKVAPYLGLPALFVVLEYRAMKLDRRLYIALVGVVVLLAVGTAADDWRLRRADRLNQEGNAELDRGRPELALEKLRHASTLNPGNAATRMNMAIAFVYLGNLQAAGEAFGQSVTADPSDRIVRANYGRWLLDIQRPEEAATQFEAALAIAPYDDASLLGLARARLQFGAREEALQLLTRAHELNPGNQAVTRMLDDLSSRRP